MLRKTAMSRGGERPGPRDLPPESDAVARSPGVRSTDGGMSDNVAGPWNSCIEQALEQLEQPWAIFDELDCLRCCSSSFASVLGRRAGHSLVGASYAELLELWLDVMEPQGEPQRSAFREQRLRERAWPRARFDVGTRSGLSLRVSERRGPNGWNTSTIVDRTEDARLLSELRAELESCRAEGAAKTEFLCSMSHELRTPLSSVLGFAQLMQRDSKEPLPERHRSRVAHILQGGEHLIRVVDDLLDLSRIEAGRMDVQCEPAEVEPLLEQLRTALEPLAQAASVGLELSLSGSGLAIVADPARFLQILMNFGSNAIKYNRVGGRVLVSACARAGEQVRIVVADTGIGIPSEQCARMFEPFYRAGQERGSIPGTGMGLAISRRLAEMMSGSVGFSSVWMQGSEFWVDVPAASSAPASRGGLSPT